MAFRRDSESQRAWQDWVEQNRETLIRCGLPEFVYTDKLTWLRFLEHGGWHPRPPWGVEMLSPHQAATLYDFIECQCGTDEYRSLLRNLEKKPASSPRRPDDPDRAPMVPLPRPAIPPGHAMRNYRCLPPRHPARRAIGRRRQGGRRVGHGYQPDGRHRWCSPVLGLWLWERRGCSD